VTKYGKPIAQLVPVPTLSRRKDNPLKDSTVFGKNIVKSVDVDWETLRNV